MENDYDDEGSGESEKMIRRSLIRLSVVVP